MKSHIAFHFILYVITLFFSHVVGVCRSYRDVDANLVEFPSPALIDDCARLINLMNNNISIVDQDALVGMTALETFNLKYNFLTEFPNFLPVKNTILRIFLKSNSIATIPANIIELHLLEVLILSENPLTWLPVLTGLSQLTDFYCTQTLLDYIHENTFSDLNNLEFIDLSDSPLASSNMTELNISSSIDRIFLDDTFLSEIKISCSTGPGNCRLRHLQITNDLQNAPDLNDVINIQILDLRYNNIYDGDQLFQGFSSMLNLTEIRVNNNHLTQFPNLTASQNTLLDIYLQSNFIDTVDPNLIKGMMNLRMLDLSDNLLKRLAADVVSYFGNLISLDLSDQILDCTMHWVAGSAIVMSDYTLQTEHLMECQGKSCRYPSVGNKYFALHTLISQIYFDKDFLMPMSCIYL